MKVEVNEKFPFEIMELGTVMDYNEGEFVFILKDELWTEFEKNALKRNKSKLFYVYEKNVSLFLFNVNDAIDTSDFVFHVDDVSGDLLAEVDELKYEIYLLDKDNIVCGVKKGNLSKEMNNAIHSTLKIQKEMQIPEASYEKMIAKLQYQYEPFELEEKAIAVCNL